MSDLSNLNINQSYQGLLNLSDSTTGITTTPQQIQDGLGNDTGIKIGTDRLEGGNLFNIYTPSVIPQYFGNGFTTSASVPGAVQNQIVANTFYDNGEYSYSAISVNCTTLEAGTSVDITFYNSQMLDTYGYVPYQKLVAEVNIATTSTGIKTATFATPLSFSATGPGFYYYSIRYNTASTPVLRLAGTGSMQATYFNWLMVSKFGLQYIAAGTMAAAPFRTTSTSGFASGNLYNTASFPTTFTSTELNLLSATATNSFGFILHTIR
jgi:hypothetical protein